MLNINTPIRSVPDADAIRIGKLCRKASPILALQNATEAGRQLQAKKKALGHRNFGSWIKANMDVLGFGERTARRYMGMAKRTLASEVSEVEAALLLNEMWGHERDYSAQIESDSLQLGPAYRDRWNPNDELFTPGPIIADARKVMRTIGLDPASCAAAQKTVKALTYFDKEVDGLKQQWSGRVWMNPPFSTRLIGPFVDKLIAGVDSGDITEAISITVNKTETKWGQALVGKADAICFWKRCIEFIRPDGVQLTKGGLWGHMACYFGPNQERFREVFGPHGVVR